MSPDIEDLLRSELRGAASGAPHHLGVDDQDLIARGHRAVVRRRVLSVAGVAVATLTIAGTIGILAPRVSNDVMPAIPTPTVTPTPDVTPTTTSTASPSATVIATPSATPSSASASSTQIRTETPSASTTLAAGLEWSDPVTVGEVAYRARLVRDGMAGEYPNYKAELRANGSLVFTRDHANGEPGLRIASDPHVIYASHVGPLSDVVSENGQPVTGEEFKSITLPYPDTGHEYPQGSMTFTIINLPRPASATENGNVASMVVRNTDGTESTLCEGYCWP
ncbi:hypothetical protein ACOCJ7_15880 [Knoellia sp. CPCC 206453]|uniref:hypothetical protein n=1 Tax=Knoellia pratensis TaxID=3404796 RepID=UPI00362317FF